MKKIASSFIAVVVSGFLAFQSAEAVDTNWGNTGTDYNTATNWTNGTPVGRRDLFTLDATMQPNISASLSAIGLFFSANNYDITASAGQNLTLTAYGTGGAANATNSTAAAIYSSATATNTIDAPIILAPASGTTSNIFQSGNGTLVLNGIISGLGVTVALNGGGNASPGTIQLNGPNTFSGGATITGTAESIVLGNDSALGMGTFTVSATSSISASSARVIGNATVLGGNATIGGSNDITFTNSVTSSGSSSRMLTVNNTGLTTLQGNLYLSEAAGTGRTLLINGTGNTTISGVVSDFNGAGTAGTLSHGGSGTLKLSNANTYSGGTLMSGGITIANADGALGTGNVSLTAASVTLTLQGGVVNNYLPDAANLSIGFTSDTVNLNFTGASDIVNTFTLAGVGQAAGTYGGTGSGAMFILPEFMGTGTITVLTSTAVPEPGTFVLMGMGAGALALLQRALRKRA